MQGEFLYLCHLYLLYGALDHVCGFFAPVTLHNIALYGSAIDRNYSMSCCLVRVKPEKGYKAKPLDRLKSSSPTETTYVYLTSSSYSHFCDMRYLKVCLPNK